MASDAHTTGAPRCASSVPVSILDRAEGLIATAEYIDVLAEVASAIARRLRDSLALQRHEISTATEWRELEVLLNIASDQAEIVATFARDAEAANMPVMRAVA